MAIRKDYAVACTANKSDTSFPSKVPTVTEPVTGTGIIDVVEPNDVLEGIPYSIGADNTTYSMRIIGWRKVSTLWVPTIIAELACTASAAVGVASAAVINTERFADTITLVSGIAVLNSPTNDTAGRFSICTTSFSKIEFTFDMTGATSANLLYCQYQEAF